MKLVEVLSLSLPGHKGGCPSHGKDKWEDTSQILTLPHDWEHLGTPETTGNGYFSTSTNSAFRHLQHESSYPMDVGNCPNFREGIRNLFNECFGKYTVSITKIMIFFSFTLQGTVWKNHCKQISLNKHIFSWANFQDCSSSYLKSAFGWLVGGW